jgi:hypothetical protein
VMVSRSSGALFGDWVRSRLVGLGFFACSAVLRVSPSEYDTNLISEKGRLHGSCVMGWDICMGSQQKMLTCALVLKNGTVVTQRGMILSFTLGRHANVYCEAWGVLCHRCETLSRPLTDSLHHSRSIVIPGKQKYT